MKGWTAPVPLAIHLGPERRERLRCASHGDRRERDHLVRHPYPRRRQFWIEVHVARIQHRLLIAHSGVLRQPPGGQFRRLPGHVPRRLDAFRKQHGHVAQQRRQLLGTLGHKEHPAAVDLPQEVPQLLLWGLPGIRGTAARAGAFRRRGTPRTRPATCAPFIARLASISAIRYSGSSAVSARKSRRTPSSQTCHCVWCGCGRVPSATIFGGASPPLASLASRYCFLETTSGMSCSTSSDCSRSRSSDFATRLRSTIASFLNVM